ncbi:MAG: FAD-dependent oxidoreductase [Lutibacter sp.]|uniref:NAD(P)/FAD-dependent oxidoreductase n=1 Tax=Lutibacter sp. TaxID=1925666 RepID=UPI00299D9894|nr:FAD-dependent oxidoreductase [Lutibacter sp.]MDX1828613.1 FAD-dependent oxidoreductase [Lutibacter sp.]
MKVLVLGGGFAGVETAIKLRKYGYDVTLISERDYMFIYPISIWIPVSKISFEDTKLNLFELQKKHGFNLLIEKITKIDNNNQQIITDKATHKYDYLFIALGMSKVKVKGMENTHSICGKPDEATVIKNKLNQLVEKRTGSITVGFGGNPNDPTATTLRGGPAFELLFNISHFIKNKGLRNNFNITFFAPMAEPGKRMGTKALQKMGGFFERYHVQTHFGKKIKEFTKDAIIFADDSQLKSDLTLYISGGDGLPIIKETSLPQNETGFVKINELCRVENEDNIYVVGDAAAIINHPWAAKQGHIAEVMADVSTYNFHNMIIASGKRKSYWEKLHIICVMDSGDGAALVMRTSKKEIMIPLPIVGHWLKKGWGWYYKQSKMKRMFRIPGM